MGFIHSLAWNRNGGRWSAIRKKAWTELAIGAGATEVFVEDTATGNPLTFITDVSKPLVSLLIPFSPKQEGSGDPSPQNIRPIVGYTGCDVYAGGKNLLDLEIVQGTIIGATGADTSNPARVRTKDYVILPPGTYTVSAVGVNCVMWYLYDLDGTYNRAIGWKNTLPNTINLEGYYRVRFAFRKSTNDEDITPADVSNVQLEVGEPATTYEAPHITHTPVVFPALGKNLLPPSAYKQGYYNGNTGEFVASDNYISYALDLKAGTYTFSTDLANCVVLRYFIGNAVTSVSEQKQKQVFTLESDNTFRITIRNTSTSAISNPNSMIEAGNVTPSAYEPFTNTVYGGTLDVVSGVLAWPVQKYSLSDIAWKKDANRPGIFYGSIPGRQGSTGVVACSTYLVRNEHISQSVDKYISGQDDYGGSYIFLRDTEFAEMTATEMKEVVTGEVVFTLATAQEVQLTPTQITALIGNNTIWSDADGEMTAVYLKKG